MLENQVEKLQLISHMFDASELPRELSELNENIQLMDERKYNQAARKKMDFSAYNQRRGRGSRK